MNPRLNNLKIRLLVMLVPRDDVFDKRIVGDNKLAAATEAIIEEGDDIAAECGEVAEIMVIEVLRLLENEDKPDEKV